MTVGTGDWHGIHPTYSNYEGMITSDYLSNLMSENTERIIEAQAKKSQNIIASLDFNAKELSNNFSNSIESLNSTFEWGFSDIIWQLEQHQKTLQDILIKLQKPLENKSIELRNRGFNAYEKKWYDDAISDLEQAAENNRYDFTVYQSLGNIFLFHKYDPTKAIKNYQKAIKYSEPYSKKIASFSYLHLGLAYYSIQDYQNAYNSTTNAIGLYPDSSFCYYEHARYCAKLNKTEEAIHNLKKIVFQEPFYCAKINSEPDFSQMRAETHELLDDIFHQYKKISENRFNLYGKLYEHALDSDIIGWRDIDSFHNNSFTKAHEYYSRSSILDFHQSIRESENLINGLLQVIGERLSAKQMETNKKLENIPSSVEQQSGKNIFSAVCFAFFFTGGLTLLYYLKEGIASWGLLFGIIGGLIIGGICGLFLGFLAAVVVYILFKIYYLINNKSEKKNQLSETRKQLDTINNEIRKNDEQKKNFRFTFSINNPGPKELSRRNELLKMAGFIDVDDD